VRISASIGLAMAAPATPLEEVLRTADLAMYRAKERGRGVLHVAG
jgi:GGDEF domain-containing protein